MVIQQRIRAENLKKIYQLVNQNRSISRAALSKETNLSKPTVSSLVDELIVNKYLTAGPLPASKWDAVPAN